MAKKLSDQEYEIFQQLIARETEERQSDYKAELDKAKKENEDLKKVNEELIKEKETRKVKEITPEQEQLIKDLAKKL